MDNMILVLFITIWALESTAKVLPCKESEVSHVCFLDDQNQGLYVKSDSPELPTKINISLKEIDVIDINEASQTISLLVKATLSWTDTRLDVIRSEKAKETYETLIDFGLMNFFNEMGILRISTFKLISPFLKP